MITSVKKLLIYSLIFLILVIFTIISLVFASPFLVKKTGICTDCTSEEKKVCHEAEEIHSGDYYKTTTKGVCVADYVCKYLEGCESTHGGNGSWSILKDESPEMFKIEKVDIKGEGLAYIISSSKGDFFWWPTKGNGRMKNIDKTSFEYLGEEYYKDKNGIYHGNKEIDNADPSSFEVIKEDWAKDKDGFFYNGERTLKDAPL
jgi:hypothetical protein